MLSVLRIHVDEKLSVVFKPRIAVTRVSVRYQYCLCLSRSSRVSKCDQACGVEEYLKEFFTRDIRNGIVM